MSARGASAWLVVASVIVALICAMPDVANADTPTQPPAGDKPKPLKKPKPEWAKTKKEKEADAKAKAEADQKAADDAKAEADAKAAADAKAEADAKAQADAAKPPGPTTAPDATKSDDDKAKPKDKEKPVSAPSPVAFKMGFEVSGYKDTQATEVLSPAITLGVENDVAGWGIDASFIADVVTAASADIVATASPHWIDERFAPTLAGHFKVGDTTLSAGAGTSVESDYIAIDADAGVAVDLAHKSVTPSLSYAFGYDIAGRHGTPYSTYSKKLQTNGIQAAITFVVNKSTIIVPGATVVLEFGDSAKPYRYVPTFAPGVNVSPGASVDHVNAIRTDVRLDEKVPQSRQRYAASMLVAHRMTSATVRFDERLYIDSWGLMATTTDFMLPVDANDVFRIWPHIRFNAQKGVDFWKLAYTATETPNGVVVPGLRAGDRELGPLIGVTAGAGFRVGGDSVGFTFKGDVIYTRFLDTLFIKQRLAGLLTTQLEMKF